MTKKQARDAGYEFQGAYSHDYEEMKTRTKELRGLGNKAAVVAEDRGYSVYWKESANSILANELKLKASAKARLEREKTELLCRLAVIEFDLNSF